WGPNAFFLAWTASAVKNHGSAVRFRPWLHLTSARRPCGFRNPATHLTRPEKALFAFNSPFRIEYNEPRFAFPRTPSPCFIRSGSHAVSFPRCTPLSPRRAGVVVRGRGGHRGLPGVRRRGTACRQERGAGESQPHALDNFARRRLARSAATVQGRA